MRGINSKRDRPVELLVGAYLSKGLFLGEGPSRRYQQFGDCHRTPPLDHASYPCTVPTAALALSYQTSLAPVPSHRLAHCYSKRSLTAICHPGTAGSASAMSPRRKITGCSGSLAL